MTSGEILSQEIAALSEKRSGWTESFSGLSAGERQEMMTGVSKSSGSLCSLVRTTANITHDISPSAQGCDPRPQWLRHKRSWARSASDWRKLTHDFMKTGNCESDRPGAIGFDR